MLKQYEPFFRLHACRDFDEKIGATLLNVQLHFEANAKRQRSELSTKTGNSRKLLARL